MASLHPDPMSSFTSRTMSLDDSDSEEGSPKPRPPPVSTSDDVDKTAEFSKYAEAYYATLNVRFVRRGLLCRRFADLISLKGYPAIAEKIHPPSTTLSRLYCTSTGPSIRLTRQFFRRIVGCRWWIGLWVISGERWCARVGCYWCRRSTTTFGRGSSAGEGGVGGSRSGVGGG